jgi:hypothetical protein
MSPLPTSATSPVPGKKPSPYLWKEQVITRSAVQRPHSNACQDPARRQQADCVDTLHRFRV